MVGLVVPDVRNSFYSTVAHALTETMGARNHQVMLCETGDDKQTELRQIRGLAAAQVSGVDQVRWVCNAWGRCWWRSDYYYRPYGYYYGPPRAYYGYGPRYYGGWHHRRWGW